MSSTYGKKDLFGLGLDIVQKGSNVSTTNHGRHQMFIITYIHIAEAKTLTTPPFSSLIVQKFLESHDAGEIEILSIQGVK